MVKKTKRWLSLLVLLTFLTAMLPPRCMAGEPIRDINGNVAAEPSEWRAKNNSTAAEITVDLLLIRPVCFAGTVIGTGCFILTLPFTLIGQNAGHAAEKLVIEPGKYTFTYPLGAY